MMNHAWLDLLLLMISLYKCTGSCNVLSPKICVSKKPKDINVKSFKMIKANSIVQYAIQIKNGIRRYVNMSVNIIIHARKIIVGILAHVFVRIVSI